jgi:peptidoglycan endopeptidase LytE
MKLSGVLLRGFYFFSFFFFLISSPAAKAEFTHTVKPGESLYSLAKKYNLSVGQLREANELTNDKIRAGENLVIPKQPSRAEGVSKGGQRVPQGTLESENEDSEIPETHTVRKGETLAGISHRYHLGVKDLQEINRLKGKNLRVGQILELQRVEEGPDELGAGIKEIDREKLEGRAEVAKVYVNGIGLLVDEKDRELLARVAKAFLGLKYGRRGTNVNGMDCSAYVRKIFSIFGIDLPRTAREQFRVGFEVAREDLQTGDLVFFKRSKAPRPTHVGIYIGNGQFIHTSLRKRQVQIDHLESRYFSARFIGGKRIEEGKKPSEFDGSNRNSVSLTQE